jgi:hypothetical protein
MKLKKNAGDVTPRIQVVVQGRVARVLIARVLMTGLGQGNNKVYIIVTKELC